MKVSCNARALAAGASATVTVAVLAKIFVPFYLIGSTAIFAASVAIGLVLVALSWRPMFDSARHVGNILIVAALFYATVIVSFVAYSRAAVPVTYLLGILIFHAIFLMFGFAAARGLKMVLLVLLGAGAIYAAVLTQHALRFGRITTGINIDDIFGIGVPDIFIALHQNVGFVLGLGVLAALGLASHRITRILAVVASPIVLIFLFHIAARTALVALATSFIFLGFATLWAYSRKAALAGAAMLILASAVASGILYQRALGQVDVDAMAPDAASRTIRELQHPDPGYRLPIWKEAWNHIVSRPDRLLLGKGVGMYPVDNGFKAPDWLLHPTEGSKHYPHNEHLEILYETGIVGFLLFTTLTFFPLVISLRQWTRFVPAEKSALAMYVFTLVGSDISGTFAYAYILQFFLALIAGIIAVKRSAHANTRDSQFPRTKTFYRGIISNGADI